MIDGVVEKLASIDLFHGVGIDDISSLLLHAATITVAAEQPIFEAGAVERAIYFVMEGSVQIELIVPFVSERVLDELTPVSVFGESSFFHPQPHPVTARAMSDVTVVRLDRTDYDRLLESNSVAALRLGANAAEILAAKLQHTDAWIADSLQTEETHRIQQKWWEFRQTLGHAFEHAPGGGFSTGGGWK